MSWVAIALSGVDFSFAPYTSNVTMDGSTITATPPGPSGGSEWDITTTQDVRFRVTMLEYNSPDLGDETPSFFEFSEGGGTPENIPNGNAGSATDFDPNPVESTDVSDLASYRSGSGSETTRDDSYIMLVEVEVELPQSSTIFVYTMNRIGQVGAWSRYTMPFPTDYFTQLDTDLYMRSGDTVHRLDPALLTDDSAPFTSVIQWPWLDFGQIGQTKMMAGFDMQGEGTVTVQFGYDESNRAAFTEAWNINPVTDSVPGGILPLPLAAPSISVKLTYTSTADWHWDGFTVYLQNFRLTS